MKKASQLLRVENFQHCVAHFLHLLLKTDGLQKLKPLVELINQCKNIVVTLHFKKSLIEQEILRQEDKKVTEELLQKLSEAQQIIDLGH